MAYLKVFLMGFIFSYVGSIPPGTLNISILRLSLEGKLNTALRFAVAVAVVEYPYAWIAVQFQYWLTSSPIVVENFQLVSAIVMTVIGIFYLLPATKAPNSAAKKFNESGFRRGMLLSVLNPMVIIYWMGFTAYLQAQGWIDLSTNGLTHAYVLGASLGALALLIGLAFYAQRLAPYAKDNRWVRLTPAIVLLSLGLYAWWKYLM